MMWGFQLDLYLGIDFLERRNKDNFFWKKYDPLSFREVTGIICGDFFFGERQVYGISVFHSQLK